MTKFDALMTEYGVSHQNLQNQKIHKICVPLIMFSVIGMLWCIPRPAAFQDIPFLNFGTIGIAFSLFYYLRLNFKYFVGMFIQALVVCFLCEVLFNAGILLPVSIVIFVLAWIGQFWGHKIEGKKPSFLQDVFFLLIGPLWVTRFLYRKLGIKE